MSGWLALMDIQPNAPSKRAAERLGFTCEGRQRMHMLVNGWPDDTDWYSIVGDERPSGRDALPSFAADGTALRGLADLPGVGTREADA